MYTIKPQVVDFQPWPDLWPLTDAALLSQHFVVQLRSVPQIWATAADCPHLPGRAGPWAEWAPDLPSYQQENVQWLLTLVVSHIFLIMLCVFQKECVPLPVKAADLCSASSCKASHFCLRVESLTFACSPSSPGWASTSRGPSNIIELILLRRSVKRRCKSCKTTLHAQVKSYLKSKRFIIDRGVI